MKVIDQKTKKQLTWEQLALKLYKDGQHIVHCDLECVAKNVLSFAPNTGYEGEYYLVDECGNQAWIDPKKYKVIDE